MIDLKMNILYDYKQKMWIFDYYQDFVRHFSTKHQHGKNPLKYF